MQPGIEALRTAAKRLKKAHAAGEDAATARVRAVLPDAGTIRHADALHVIAREAGFDSWPKLKFAREAAAMTRAERAERLKRALYFGQAWMVEKLLADEPDLLSHDFGLEIATYDIAAARRRLARDPEAATAMIGMRTPILHLAFSHYIHMAPGKRDDMLALAALLVENGADVNDGYPPEPGSDHKLSALYGALGHAGNMVLAEWFLKKGADPNDNESLYHATELGHTRGLRLLLEHGADPHGTNALPRALDFDDLEAVRLLLDHGADPNEALRGDMADHPSGQPVDTITGLHQAARRWRSAETAELLLDHGADAMAVWQGHTPYALALIYGNAQVANALAARGHVTPLSETETVLAACAEGRAPDRPLSPDRLSDEDRRLLVRLISGPVPIDHLQALVTAGLDPNASDEMGLTPLHVAAWEGLPDRLAWALTLDPDLSHRNAYGGDALGTAIHGAEFCPNAETRDHLACARLLLEAGVKYTADTIDECGTEDMAEMLEAWREDA